MVEIRVARRHDIPGIAEVIRRAYQEFAPILGDIYPPYLADLLDVRARMAAGVVLVAEAGGRIVGTASLYADGGVAGFGWPSGWAVVRAVAVDPDARGRGAGHALMQECTRRTLRAGRDELCLHTAEFMTAAIALYEAHGFGRDPRFDVEATEHFGVDGCDPVPVVAYRRRLTSGRPARRARVPAQAPWPLRRIGDRLAMPAWVLA
jgi:ribosomal protein S18 acetylase RimI-like enzyme